MNRSTCFLFIALFMVSCSDGRVGKQGESSFIEAREIHTPGSALSPRDGGYVDINHIESLQLAIFSLQEDVVTYEFQLYTDSQMSQLLGSTTGVPKSNLETYTAWSLAPDMISTKIDGSQTLSLESGKTYYWRARATWDGDTLGWTSLYSFEVRNLCDIAGTQYAEHVVEVTTKQACDILVYIDPEAILGPPDAAGHQPVGGFLSLGYSGAIALELGKTASDGAGDDIRVYEQTSSEWIEVFAANSEIGPWYSMGVVHCPDFCDFDLRRTGLSYARYIRIEDMFPASLECYETAGADIDSIVALNYTTSSSQCAVQ